MTGEQWITLAFVVMVWTVLAGSPQLRQHMGNLSIAGFVAALVTCSLHGAFDRWVGSEHELATSIAIYVMTIVAFMWVAVHRNWNTPTRLEIAMDEGRS